MPVILATQEAGIRRIMVKARPEQIVVRSCLENTHHKKRAGGVAQVIQHLPSKYEALNSNPSTMKKKKKRKKEMQIHESDSAY
jgi:hypothetical protein